METKMTRRFGGRGLLAFMVVLGLAACDDGGGGGDGGGGSGGSGGGSGGSGGGPGGGGGGPGGSGGSGGDGGSGGGGSCDPGTRTCPCREGGDCNDGLKCDRGFCVDDDGPPPGCTPGDADCTCDAGACDAGLLCLDNRCQMPPPAGDGLVPTNAEARGCEVLFEELAGAVTQVRFADGVVGEHARRQGKAAVAFVTSGPLDTSAATIELPGGVAASAQTLRLVSATCFDANGRALAGDNLRWD